MPRYLDGTRAQVEAMRASWEADGGSLEKLTLDAFEALDNHPDLTIQRVAEFVPKDSQLDCSVAGGYRDTPPTLVVTESMSRRRQQFTLLHELGHHVQQTNLELGRRVVGHTDPTGFEDACCDAFAASILLPDDMVDDASRPFGGPTAQTAVELFELSNASRAAISVRLTERLKGSGVVTVVSEAGVVTFAAARGSMYPPARGSNQSENPLIRAALDDTDSTRVWSRDDARIWYLTGHSSNQLYGQAAWAGDRLFVVMVEESAPWRSFSPPRDFTATRTRSKCADCDTCGTNFEVRIYCFTCSRPKCPASHCACTKPAEMTCDTCYLVKHVSQFFGDSTTCVECS
ncbi:ImmA/IrrE family metallo-endopeptidase [Microbacterium profundi]|uniref:ImmA/IrrE family metallo-endopeptidase n=1 Tax=Microbacterium profundi TaxID=450380 RepID=UPI00051A6229|nr:ImmA/IrrE family metallo-endopeptidase [Microbacterium profundi]